MRLGVCFGLLLAAVSGWASGADAPADSTVDFNRDIRPILSDNCYFCHGFDKNHREAGLRLDTKEGLLSVSDNGPIVKPGSPAESELYRRIISEDPAERMPDPKSHKKLSPRDIAKIKAWIEQGAQYKGHWSYIPPQRPAVPVVGANPQGQAVTAIDAFVASRLSSIRLAPSPEADRATLIRRLSFDLTGLPPTAAEVDAFVNDRSPDAYAKLVERLLSSPHFGERMAMYWLDVVRYADTIGYHSDNIMNVAPYKEWVIEAFNQNMPFDRFTIEQIAGDLLENPSQSQKIATAYNRLLQTTEEGGAQAREYEVKNFTDRVRNVSTVWLGATMGCAQCHDHKFDPISQKDFYSMAAFFADVTENAIGRREAGMLVPTKQQETELKRLEDAVAAAKSTVEKESAKLAEQQAEWEKQQIAATKATNAEWVPLKPESYAAASGTLLAVAGQDQLRVVDLSSVPATETYTLKAKTDLKTITGIRVEANADRQLGAGGPGTAENGNFVLTEVKLLDIPGGKNAGKFRAASAGHSQGSYPVEHAIDGKNNTGWAILPEVGKSHTAVFELAKPIEAKDGISLTVALEFLSQFPKHQMGRVRVSVTSSANPAGVPDLPQPVRAALAVDAAKRNDKQKQTVADHYRSIAPQLKEHRDAQAAAEKARDEYLKGVPKVLVTTAAAPRKVRILKRGEWLDTTGEEVQPGIPAFLGALDLKDRRANRLDLAKWLVAKDNPLTSRVFVNRMWKLFHGQGLSKVLDDLGYQGEWPTHPDLLDWLAVEFVESGWDVKHMVRLMVTSRTYRQTSTPTAEQLRADPDNRFYARQGRWRLDAEMVRDNALATSGLLVNHLGGPVAYPYQPPGYWFALNFPTREWKNDTGDGLYRRGLYTHWQRSFLHPMLLAFDAPSREESVCERVRSNIPQQALVLLNDPSFVEAARVFAARIMKEGGDGTEARIRWAVQQSLSRPAKPQEVEILTALYEKHKAEYAADAESAKKLLSVGASPAPKEIDATELAAWTSVARAVFNMSEMITRY